MMNRRTVIEEEKRSSSGNELFKQASDQSSTGRSKVVSMTIVHAGRQLTTTTPSPTLQHYNKRRQLCILKLKAVAIYSILSLILDLRNQNDHQCQAGQSSIAKFTTTTTTTTTTTAVAAAAAAAAAAAGGTGLLVCDIGEACSQPFVCLYTRSDRHSMQRWPLDQAEMERAVLPAESSISIVCLSRNSNSQ
ncbi:hypothetical protein T4B_2585 [Trichinella pseudospiralis]|uniref:Uncharacterized protein n=1 Tax=Trichinella pseudospiralis TaxID=6337 RepID=A0A0V1ITW2_TRIPS|nr:hypothetical protein T4B_2585 [Trichinella pseudospiralis]